MFKLSALNSLKNKEKKNHKSLYLNSNTILSLILSHQKNTIDTIQKRLRRLIAQNLAVGFGYAHKPGRYHGGGVYVCLYHAKTKL
jgi:hypothetical protein